MKKMYISLLCITISVVCCTKQKQVTPVAQGLVGAYYGNPDFTRIKEAEVISALEWKWDEETGHGSSWSGRWEGMIIAPITGNVTFILRTNKGALLKIGQKSKVKIEKESKQSRVTVEMYKDKTYPIILGYMHSQGGEGTVSVRWQWDGQDETAISKDRLFYTEEHALRWNWIPEPDPNSIDFSKFVRVSTENVIVYYEKGHFCGWPANNGLWNWDDEILVGFTLAYYQEKELHHSIDEKKPTKSVLARSLDGGITWSIEDPQNYVGDGRQPEALEEKINFSHPDFAMRCGGNYYFFSYDRGKTWHGPHEFPDFDREKLTSRTDYIISGDDDCHLFLSTKEEQVESNMQDRAFCARTSDGGKSFFMLAWIGEPITVRSVMPSTVRISQNHFVSALRRRHDQQFENKPFLPKNWIDVYESKDNGASWNFLSKVAETDMGKHNGNPPSLAKLRDGRLCVTYGYRAVPYGIRAKLSSDNGQKWGEEIHLRDDGRTFDIGYTRSVQRLDGKIVTIYYYTTKSHREQHIAATIWDPDKLILGKN
jgi:hypothetical protein